MIQKTNHRLIQVLLNEGARYYSNGGIINLHELICDKLNMPTKEAWELLLNCDICNKDKDYIECEIKKCDTPIGAPSEIYEKVISYIENDAEIAIPIERFFDALGNHITKKEYGLILIEILCSELRERFINNKVENG